MVKFILKLSQTEFFEVLQFWIDFLKFFIYIIVIIFLNFIKDTTFLNIANRLHDLIFSALFVILFVIVWLRQVLNNFVNEISNCYLLYIKIMLFFEFVDIKIGKSFRDLFKQYVC